jgi:hypothetical protein
VGGTMSFAVTSNDTIFCIKFDQPYQSQFDTPCQNSVTGSYPITNGQFSISYPTSEGPYILTGQFIASSTQATGYMLWPPGADEIASYFTWSASKQ